MQIVDNRSVNKKTLFSDLVEGDVFNYHGDTVMKVYEENEYNAVILIKGVLAHLDDWEYVTKICGSFVITD